MQIIDREKTHITKMKDANTGNIISRKDRGFEDIFYLVLENPESEYYKKVINLNNYIDCTIGKEEHITIYKNSTLIIER